MNNGPILQDLMPSILDRLIDPESAGTAARQGFRLDQMIQAVQRDVEDLLNTRRTLGPVPEGMNQVGRSVLAFGLPELTGFDVLSPKTRQDVGRMIEWTIGCFEPRLKDVHASVIYSGAENQTRTIHFRIEARLCVDPAPEVAFDTVLQLTTGHYSVQAAT